LTTEINRLEQNFVEAIDSTLGRDVHISSKIFSSSGEGEILELIENIGKHCENHAAQVLDRAIMDSELNVFFAIFRKLHPQKVCFTTDLSLLDCGVFSLLLRESKNFGLLLKTVFLSELCGITWLDADGLRKLLSESTEFPPLSKFCDLGKSLIKNVSLIAF